MKSIWLFISVLILFSTLSGQTHNNLDMLEFYPNTIGNSWFYGWFYADPVSGEVEGGIEEVFVSKDTTMGDFNFRSLEYNFGTWAYENYFERIDSATGDIMQINPIISPEEYRVDNVYAGIGDTIGISANRNLPGCSRIVVLSIRDTMINNFETTIREVVGLPCNKKLFFARNIGLLGTGPDYWIDSAQVGGIIFTDISSALTDLSNFESNVSSLNLYQNYPNPFNPSTTIGYSLHERSNVTLTIFNLLGEEIDILENGEKGPGYHSVSFTSNDLSSGIYFYQLVAGSTIQSKKCILIR